jgi:hypothetical protein
LFFPLSKPYRDILAGEKYRSAEQFGKILIKKTQKLIKSTLALRLSVVVSLGLSAVHALHIHAITK